MLTPQEAEGLLAAPKDAGLAQPVWTESRSPQNNALLAARLMLGVTAPPYDLQVEVDWRGPLVQQHRLLVVGQSGDLARLCMSRQHQDDPHWHYFYNMTKQVPRVEPAVVPAGMNLQDVDAMFLEVFVPTMKIANLLTPGRLFP